MVLSSFTLKGVIIMTRRWIVPILCGLSLLISPTAWAAMPGDLANILLQAHNNKQPIPVLTVTYKEMDLATAYAVQKSYLDKRLPIEGLVGFKAGLTTEVAQKRFGVPHAISGILLGSGDYSGAPVINKAAFVMPMIETEIGFVVKKTISVPMKDVDELKQYIGTVMPAIELPDLGFADVKALKGVDLIAANVSAVQFIRGNEINSEAFDLDQRKVVLRYNGQVVNRGSGHDAMGGQWEAALWLVNQVVSQGWKVEPGHVLLTGALGNMIPGKPGSYEADYGDFGKIVFEII